MKKMKLLSKLGIVMALSLCLNVFGIVNNDSEQTGDQINVDYPVEEECLNVV